MLNFSRRAALVAVMAVLAGCSGDDKPANKSAADERESAAKATIDRFKADDAGIAKFFDTAAGYAVFPSVGKGGLIVGGGYGEGVVYEKGGKAVGYTTMTFASIGAQIGGQSYKEAIFFKEPADLQIFQRGNFELDAQATAVALKSGASTTAGYSKGVAIFVTGEKGLMAEASVGGQKFRYFPK